MMTATSSYADPASAASMTRPEFSLVIDDSRPLQVISGDYTAYSNVHFALNQVMQINNPAQFKVSIQFDGRLFAADDTAMLSYLDKYETASTVITLADPPALSSVTYDIPDIFNGTSTASTTILFPLTVVDRYPEEGVDHPLPLILTILARDGSELARAEWLPDDTRVPVSAWGAEVTAVWSETGVVDGVKTTVSKYRYPSTICCMSTGPHPIPAGSTLAIELDSLVLESCAVQRIATIASTASAATTIAPGDLGIAVVSPLTQAPWPATSYLVMLEETEGRLRMTITLNDEVPAGAAVEVTLRAVEIPAIPVITSVTYASAFLAGPAQDGYWQRATRKYLVTDLTGSGTPRITNVAQGEI
ncbi:hypothetical protein [Rathayibacter rathayi]|uniref:hypothetical protein n=1 Tax=Rathayibacter rathayi TaxID=33887 RepID=UPI000FDAAF61|nr:hypothetical protein [Rathayibacter rathayi]MWV75007.1 hypothetical protein [Rathayibacter rathayi NCPPB 2980 = VKM Ac-1601]